MSTTVLTGVKRRDIMATVTEDSDEQKCLNNVTEAIHLNLDLCTCLWLLPRTFLIKIKGMVDSLGRKQKNRK